MPHGLPSNPVEGASGQMAGVDFTYTGGRWNPAGAAVRIVDLEQKVSRLEQPPGVAEEADELTDDDFIAVQRDGETVLLPASSIERRAGGQIARRSRANMGQQSGVVVMDFSDHNEFVMTITGDSTLSPIDVPIGEGQVTATAVLNFAGAHTISTQNMTSIGLGFDDRVFVGGEIAVVTFQVVPGTVGLTYELHLPLNQTSDDVILGANLTLPTVPPPPPTSSFSVHYYPTSSDFTTGGLPADGVTFGSGGVQRWLHLALDAPFDPGVLNVRWYSDPSDVPALSTWGPWPADGENGFIGGSGKAPMTMSIDSTVGPTRLNDGSWATDGTRQMYAVVRKTDLSVEVIPFSPTINNGTVAGTTPPLAPTLSVPTLGGDGEVLLGWAAPGSGTAIANYQVRHGATSPPTGSWQTVGDVLTHTVANLNGGQVRYFEVRGLAADGTPGATSNIRSATPSGTTTGYPISSGKTKRIIPARATELCGTTYGPRFSENSRFGMALPYPDPRVNGNKTKPGSLKTTATTSVTTAIQNKLTNYAGRESQFPPLGDWRSADQRDGGQRTVMTAVIAFLTNPNGKGLSAKNDPIGTLIDSAETARSRLRQFADIATAVKQAGRADRFELDIYHEGNGGWYSTYSGQQASLIGDPQLVNASAAYWGSELAGLLQQAGQDGHRGPVVRYVLEKIAEEIRNVDPDIAIGLTMAAGSGAPPAAGQVADQTDWLIDKWLPDASLWDVFNINVYCRGAGRPILKSGRNSNSLNTADYTFTSMDGMFADAYAIAQQYNKVMGVGEYGIQFDDWETNTTNGSNATDRQGAVHWKRFHENVSASPVPWHSICYWRAQGDKQAGASFMVNPNIHPLTYAAQMDTYARV